MLYGVLPDIVNLPEPIAHEAVDERVDTRARIRNGVSHYLKVVRKNVLRKCFIEVVPKL